MRKDGSFVKTERLRNISTQIAKAFNQSDEKKVDLAVLISWIEMNIGLTKARALEYIDTCCSVHGWSIIDGKLSLCE